VANVSLSLGLCCESSDKGGFQERVRPAALPFSIFPEFWLSCSGSHLLHLFLNKPALERKRCGTVQPLWPDGAPQHVQSLAITKFGFGLRFQSISLNVRFEFIEYLGNPWRALQVDFSERIAHSVHAC